jgi:hypothetical protein
MEVKCVVKLNILKKSVVSCCTFVQKLTRAIFKDLADNLFKSALVSARFVFSLVMMLYYT